MRQKTLWMVFGSLIVLVAILVITVALTNDIPEQTIAGTDTAAEQPIVSMPADITNPGQVEDLEITAESFTVTVAGLKRTELVTGRAADEQITNMHMGAVKPQKSFVASYQGAENEKADIWVSVVASEAEAKAQLELMHEKIDASQAFTNHQVMPIGEILYHYVEGMGQEHFFYYRGDDVIWIGISDHQLLPSVTSIL